MGWTVTGETGKTLDASADRALSALNISRGQLTFRAMAPDTLVWTCPTSSAAGASTIIPDVGQVVILKKDGTQKFRGHVTKAQVGLRDVTVEVAGPWWWLEKIPLTAAGDERAKLAFASGATAQASMDTLMSRAYNLGLPINGWTVDTCYALPQVTVSLCSLADAIAELLRWVPDAVPWWDYETYTLPQLRVTRRGNAARKTLTVGADVFDLSISKETGTVVSKVQLNYATRSGGGSVSYSKQEAGTGELGKIQILTISGPELDTFMPPEPASVNITSSLSGTAAGSTPSRTVSGGTVAGQTLPGETLAASGAARSSYFYRTGWDGTYITNRAGYAITDPYNFVAEREPTLCEARATWGSLGTYWRIPASGQIQYRAGGTSSGTLITLTVPPLRYTDKYGGAYSTSGQHLLRGEKPPEWLYNYAAPEITTTIFDCTLNCTLYVFWLATATQPEWTKYVSWDLVVNNAWLASGPSAGGGNPANGAYEIRGIHVALPVVLGSGQNWDGVTIAAPEIKVTTSARTVTDREIANLFLSGQSLNLYVSGSASGSGTAGQSWQFQTPPAGLAQNLLDAQIWQPWIGQISALPTSGEGENWLGKKFCVSGSVAAASTMDALARSVEWELETSRCTVDLGPPARMDWRSLVARLRRNTQDNLYYL